MFYATITNTGTTTYDNNGVTLGAGETLVVAPQHIANFKLTDNGRIYHIDLGHTVHNPWSSVGHSNVPQLERGTNNGSGGAGLLLEIKTTGHYHWGHKPYTLYSNE